MNLALGLTMPFAGTMLGALPVFFMKKDLHPRVEKLLLGFAAGIMLAASVWSLLLPAIELSKPRGCLAWYPASAGFLIGTVFLLLFDRRIERRTALSGGQRRLFSMIFAVTLHNIPEGLAVGVALSGALLGNTGVSMPAALALSFGIAVQNLPEGAIVSMPLKSAGMTKRKAFLLGGLSGAVEPLAAVAALLLTALARPMLPYLLAFAAGAMIDVVVQELIPASQRGKNGDLAALSAAAGFAVMMILDVALG